ncbi:zinc finger protein 184-like [Macrosteles quadrilineatus]|uniref:zinc finger protein 184-like n=1 Tax=Macrosteles quadrilineatus TaxID=74068 RepID=UPI0023E110FE|nr:zinc finger protein 184-like [Macrosteles quadrilineatus]
MMPGSSKKCCVPSCLASYQTLKKFGVNLSFFAFPKDKSLRNKWLLKCNRRPSEVSLNDSVCSRHFHLSDYRDGMASKIANVKPKRLKPDAVPSRFLKVAQKDPTNLSHHEYHKFLAQEILSEEKEASKSSDPPIYLDFLTSGSDNVGNQSKSSSSFTGTEKVHHTENPNSDTLDCFEDCTLSEAKEKLTVQPVVNPIETTNHDKVTVTNNAGNDNFIGRCYVCDKAIRQCDLDKFSREDFTRVVQKILEGISTEYVVVMTQDDGLCGACRNVVSRISKLEAELRTATVGLRALLRLNYSLPPPAPENNEKSHSQFRTEKPDKTLARSKNSIQTADVEQRSKITQTGVMLKNKKTQTNEKYFVEESDLKFVSSIDQVEYMEAGDLQIQVVEGTEETLEPFPVVKEADCIYKVTNSAADSETPNEDGFTEEIVIDSEDDQPSEIPAAIQPVKPRPVNRKYLGILKCSKCNFKTKSSKIMKAHMLSFIYKEGFYCYICEFAYHNMDHFKKHAKNHSETSQDRRCIFCDATIHDKLHMKYHIEARHKPNPFHHPCSKCNQVFSFASLMRRHMRLKHKMLKRYTCDTCGSVFGDKIKYDNHVEYYHRPSLACKFCSKEYPTIKQLVLHENSLHRFDRTEHYQCSFCPRKFVRQELLLQHETHHTEHYDHRCGVCGYGFNEEEAKERHERFCLMGPRSRILVSRKSALNRQQSFVKRRKFTRDPFGGHQSLVCDVCGKIIHTRANYKIHRELHNSPSGFQCHVCGKKFRYKDNMRVHIKNLHKDTDNIDEDDPQ